VHEQPVSLPAVLLPRQLRIRDTGWAKACQSTLEPSQHLLKQSAVMTIKYTTML